MKIAYIDCFAGISGDMFLGALIDLGLDINYLKKELKKISLAGYSLSVKKEHRNGFCGTRLIVKVTEKHTHRSLNDILDLIQNSKLQKKVKEKSCELFKMLGQAEAKAHGEDISKIHFHEVGAVDSIIDIIGAVIGVDRLGFDEIYSNIVKLGRGMLGKMPLPAPATLEILKDVPIQGTNRNVEMVTPTGAVLLKGLVKAFGDLPKMKLERIGCGVGTREDKDLPNIVRIFIGEKSHTVNNTDSVNVIETNIDDMNPQRYGDLMDTLFKKGALDVYWTSVQMKKNRPGILVTVLSPKDKMEDLIETLFKNTTTFGVRYYEADRRILGRKFKNVSKSRIKIGTYNGKIYTISPEHEDWKEAIK